MSSSPRSRWFWLALTLAACSASTSDPAGSAADDTEGLSGGDTTVFSTTHDAFAQAPSGLSAEAEDAFFVGNAIFNRGWVTAPASVQDIDGLGPVFNATNCSGCHFKDGRGRPPEESDEPFLSMLLRLSVPGQSAHGEPAPEPTYGGQLQGSSILGVPAEGQARVTYTEQPGAYGDGAAFSLRRPTYAIEALGYGPMRDDVMMSPRVAPQMIGLGLLEAVPEATILALADPDDRDGDGISGRPNHVWDVAAQQAVLGRFGWKSNQPSLRQQVLGAFNGDMGITSQLFGQDDCTSAQDKCRSALDGGSPELRADFAEAVIRYSGTLAVPARRNWRDPQVKQGRALFAQARCTGCHVDTLQTRADAEEPVLAGQTIHPYTDLLLHDMGEGLGDGRPDFEATGSEWRTPPLWGIGLFKVVNKHTYYLHDGRARDLAEAILWHGGEAQAARDAFVAMSADERAAMLAFLGSL